MTRKRDGDTPLDPGLKSRLRGLSEDGLEPGRDLWPDLATKILASDASRRSRAWLRPVAVAALFGTIIVIAWWYAPDPFRMTTDTAKMGDTPDVIERISYDRQDNRVEIEFRGARRIVLDASDPTLTGSLVRVLEESQRPSQRLRALRVLAAAPESHASQQGDLLRSLGSLLESESNSGLRLHAVRLLRALPGTSQRDELLILTLARDTNSAVRIEALDGLLESPLFGRDGGRIESAVQETRDAYLKYKLRARRSI